MHRSAPRTPWLAALACVAIIAASYGNVSAEGAPAAIAGVPFPKTSPEYRVPVSQGCQISQGNAGRLSHMDQYNRYAWDFGLQVGSPVVASRGGVARRVKDDSYRGGADTKWMKDGNEIVLDHLDGFFTLYLHLSPGASVREGEYVIQGQVIGHSGWTGFAQVPHLHYTVQREDGVSVESKFADFKQNAGVPGEGNMVRPARAPVVPQDVIDRYLAAWRACTEAERLGVPDLALEFASAVTKRSKHKDYFYHQALTKRATAHRQTIVDQVAEYFNESAPDGSNLADLLQLKVTLEQSKDRPLKKLGQSLQETLKSYPEKVRTQWEKADKVLQQLVAALRAECSSEYRTALEHYMRALDLRCEPARKVALRSFSRFARERNKVVIRTLSSLAAEVAEAPKEYLPGLRDAAGSAWHTHDLLLDIWERRDPECGVEPIEVRARAERLMQQIREAKQG